MKILIINKHQYILDMFEEAFKNIKIFYCMFIKQESIINQTNWDVIISDEYINPNTLSYKYILYIKEELNDINIQYNNVFLLKQPIDFNLLIHDLMNIYDSHLDMYMNIMNKAIEINRKDGIYLNNNDDIVFKFNTDIKGIIELYDFLNKLYYCCTTNTINNIRCIIEEIILTLYPKKELIILYINITDDKLNLKIGYSKQNKKVPFFSYLYGSNININSEGLDMDLNR